MRVSTLVLIVAFLALFWVYHNFEPKPAATEVPPTAVVPPGGTLPPVALSRLYRLELPTRPNGVPSGRCGDAFPSFACTRRFGSFTL